MEADRRLLSETREFLLWFVDQMLWYSHENQSRPTLEKNIGKR